MLRFPVPTMLHTQQQQTTTQGVLGQPHVYRARQARARRLLPALLAAAGVLVLLLLVFWNLDRYPLTWFDEGSHLHVPKTLVTRGVYADLSSEGYRYYGPTVGVGPTVMLPIAGAFQLAGIGLLQARIVMALYLVAALGCFFGLAAALRGRRYALWATALVASSASVDLLVTGRQVLGEVPGLFFLLAALWVWLPHIENASLLRLAAAGALLGLALVTKYQFVIMVVPALGLLWLANLVYFRSAPQRTYWVLGGVAAAFFGAWQLLQFTALGPATFQENVAQFRQFASGAALVFSTEVLRRTASMLLSFDAYGLLLIPAALFGLLLSLRRSAEGQRWAVITLLVGVNLSWYAVASVGWTRYAFPGFALGALLVAALVDELTNGYQVRLGKAGDAASAARAALVAYAALVIAVPLVPLARSLVQPPPNDPAAAAAFINQTMPQDALIETWEPELGFLTNHNYHYPPQILLNDAVQHIWSGGPSPTDQYTFLDDAQPDYLVIGQFAAWVGMYPDEKLQDYEHMRDVGAYWLYQRKPAGGDQTSANDRNETQ